jgi:hypothetical protein
VTNIVATTFIIVDIAILFVSTESTVMVIGEECCKVVFVRDSLFLYWQGKLKCLWKMCANFTLFSINPTSVELEFNLEFCGGKSAICCLSDGMAGAVALEMCLISARMCELRCVSLDVSK